MSSTGHDAARVEAGQKVPQIGYGAAVAAWFLCALFYSYQYAVRSAPGVMRGAMAATWGHDPVAAMNAYYYMVYAFAALLAGTLLDRYGPKMTLPLGSVTVGALCLLLASGNEHLAVLGFTIQGLPAVFGFIGSVYVAGRSLPPRSLSTFVGMSQMLGMAGAALGVKPVEVMIDRLGWSWQFVWVLFAVAGGLLAVLLWIALRHITVTKAPFSMKALIHPYEVVFKNPQTYLCGLIGGLLFAPTTIGVMVWATKFLHEGENLRLSDAAGLASMVPVGWIIGCPLLGFISDRMGRRKPILIGGALVMAAASLAAIYVEPSFPVRYTIALVLGIASGAAMIPFTVIKEANPPEVNGSAAGAMNFLAFAVTGVLSPLHAALLEPAPGRAETLHGFQQGLVPLTFGIAVAILLSFFLRETGHAAAQTERASGQPPSLAA